MLLVAAGTEESRRAVCSDPPAARCGGGSAFRPKQGFPLSHTAAIRQAPLRPLRSGDLAGTTCSPRLARTVLLCGSAKISPSLGHGTRLGRGERRRDRAIYVWIGKLEAPRHSAEGRPMMLERYDGPDDGSTLGTIGQNIKQISNIHNFEDTKLKHVPDQRKLRLPSYLVPLVDHELEHVYRLTRVARGCGARGRRVERSGVICPSTAGSQRVTDCGPPPLARIAGGRRQHRGRGVAASGDRSRCGVAWRNCKSSQLLQAAAGPSTRCAHGVGGTVTAAGDAARSSRSPEQRRVLADAKAHVNARRTGPAGSTLNALRSHHV